MSKEPGALHVGLLDKASDFDARTITLLEITFVGANAYIETDLRAAQTRAV